MKEGDRTLLPLSLLPISSHLACASSFIGVLYTWQWQGMGGSSVGKGCGVKSTWLPLDATDELLVHNLESGYTTLAKDLKLCANIEGLLEQQEHIQGK